MGCAGFEGGVYGGGRVGEVGEEGVVGGRFEEGILGLGY